MLNAALDLFEGSSFSQRQLFQQLFEHLEELQRS